MLIANALLVILYPRDGQNAVLFLQPAGVQLIIWNEPEEQEAQHDGQQPCPEEYGFPGCDG